jgi:hypothetical protein
MEETFHYPEGDGQTNGWTKKRAWNFASLLLLANMLVRYNGDVTCCVIYLDDL